MSTRKIHSLLVFFLSVLTVVGLLLVFPQFETTFKAAEKTSETTSSSVGGMIESSTLEREIETKNGFGQFELSTAKDSYLIGENAISHLSITMNQNITNSKIEIRLSNKYLKEAPRASDISITPNPPSVELDKKTNEYVITYDLPLISAGYEGQIPFNYTTKVQETPHGYKLPIVAKVTDANGDELTQTETSTLYLAKPPSPTKMVKVNSGGFTNSNNTEIVTGEEDPDNPGFTYGKNHLDKLLPIQYQFRYTQSSTAVGTRIYEEWEIKDKLPEGAYFVQSENPDWTYNEETNIATFKGKTNAVLNEYETISSPELTVFYPSFPIDDRRVDVLNEADIIFYPKNPMVDEENSIGYSKISHKSISLRKADKPLSITKSGTKIYDLLEDKINNSVSWKIVFNNPINPSDETMENVIIRDFNLDERLKYTSVLVYSTYGGIDGPVTLSGILEDGTEVIIDDNYTVLKDDYSTPPIPLEEDFKEIVLKTNPGTKINPSIQGNTKSTYLMINSKFRDPENTHLKDPEKQENLINSVSATGKYEGDGNEWVTSEVKGTAAYVPVNTSLDIRTRRDDGPNPLFVNDISKYRLEVAMREVPNNQKLEDLVAMDLLPVGFDYVPESSLVKLMETKSFDYEEIEDHEPEVIPDYQGTGRTALIWNLPDSVYKGQYSLYTTYPYEIVYKTQVTSLAKDGENLNEGYLAWSNMDEIKAYKDRKTPDIYDLNNNGNREEFIVKDSYKINYKAAVELIATKEAFGSADNGYVFYPRIAHTELDSEASYRLRVLNNSLKDLEHLRLLDVLPYVGDKTVSKNEVGVPYKRNSEYQVHLRGPVQAPDDYTVYYSLDDPGDENFDSFYEKATWATNVQDYAKVVAIKIEMKTGEVFERNEFMEVIVPVSIPDDYELTDGKLANNSFGVSTNAPESENKLYFESNNAPMDVIKYKISGHVFQDRNLSGTLDESSPGIKNHLVELVDNEGMPILDLKGNPIKTTTDSEGYYEMEVFQQGKYRIKILTPDGYKVTEPKSGDKFSQISIDGKDSLTDLFSLESNHKNVIRNAGYYQEEKSINIFKYDAETMTISNNSQPTDEEIEKALPLEGAVFEVYQGTVMDSKFLLKDEAGNPMRFKTNETGHTSFNGKLGEDYLIVEVKSPQGFELLKKPIHVKNVDNLTDDELWVYVGNYTMSVLPYAGGTVNLLLVIAAISSILIITMGTLMFTNHSEVTKKRRRRRR